MVEKSPQMHAPFVKVRLKFVYGSFSCIWCSCMVGSVGIVSGVSFGLVWGSFGMGLGFV